MIFIEKKVEGITISIQGIFVGEDLCIIISGGDKPHIGSMSLGDNEKKLVSFTYKSHKDDVIVEMVSKALKGIYHQNYVICGGIHIDNITSKQINLVKLICKELIEEFIKSLEA